MHCALNSDITWWVAERKNDALNPLQLRQSRLDLNSQDVGTTFVSFLDNSRPPNALYVILYHHYLREHLKVRKGLRNYNVQPRCVGKDNYRVFVKFNVSSSFKKRRGEQEQWVNFSTPTKSSSGKMTWHQKDYNEIASIHTKLASELQLLGRTFCPQFFLTGFHCSIGASHWGHKQMSNSGTQVLEHNIWLAPSQLCGLALQLAIEVSTSWGLQQIIQMPGSCDSKKWLSLPFPLYNYVMFQKTTFVSSLGLTWFASGIKIVCFFQVWTNWMVKGRVPTADGQSAKCLSDWKV